MKNLMYKICFLLCLVSVSHMSSAANISFGDYNYNVGETSFYGDGLE